MKTIFGFLTGAAIGAGGLFGLRKVLAKLEEPAPSVGSSPSPAPNSSENTTEIAAPESNLKVEEALEVVPAPETPLVEITTTGTLSDNVETTGETLENQVSLVGEPVERHEEPLAAIESAPAATTPRSESAEVEVPEKVAVEPASTTPVKPRENGTAKASPNGNKNGKASKKNTKPPQKDDFTIILDIGNVFNQKLHEAGINSFKDLARLTPAQVEEKTGIPAERVEHGRWIEQVKEILAGKVKD